MLQKNLIKNVGERALADATRGERFTDAAVPIIATSVFSNGGLIVSLISLDSRTDL